MALGLLERRDGRYANTPAAEIFLDRNKPSYVGGIHQLHLRRPFKEVGRRNAARGAAPGVAAGEYTPRQA